MWGKTLFMTWLVGIFFASFKKIISNKQTHQTKQKTLLVAIPILLGNWFWLCISIYLLRPADALLFKLKNMLHIIVSLPFTDVSSSTHNNAKITVGIQKYFQIHIYVIFTIFLNADSKRIHVWFQFLALLWASYITSLRFHCLISKTEIMNLVSQDSSIDKLKHSHSTWETGNEQQVVTIIIVAF